VNLKCQSPAPLYIYLSDEFTKSQVQIVHVVLLGISAGVSLISDFLMLMRLLFSACLMGSACDDVKLFEIVENWSK
jgi:hypothetical protein